MRGPVRLARDFLDRRINKTQGRITDLRAQARTFYRRVEIDTQLPPRTRRMSQKEWDESVRMALRSKNTDSARLSRTADEMLKANKSLEGLKLLRVIIGKKYEKGISAEQMLSSRNQRKRP